MFLAKAKSAWTETRRVNLQGLTRTHIGISLLEESYDNTYLS